MHGGSRVIFLRNGSEINFKASVVIIITYFGGISISLICVGDSSLWSTWTRRMWTQMPSTQKAECRYSGSVTSDLGAGRRAARMDSWISVASLPAWINKGRPVPTKNNVSQNKDGKHLRKTLHINLWLPQSQVHTCPCTYLCTHAYDNVHTPHTHVCVCSSMITSEIKCIISQYLVELIGTWNVFLF